ncbi:MAG: siderophore-interacting protein [Bifidobacteriaceae bacterium]|jgi:NADPH-dependent ferric siderophore reductase|nr:siderophore-interacting protein [Bifidobacteriaceae bacterium]
MGLYPRLMPETPQLFRAEVASTTRLSPSFQRVTVIGPELDQFEWRGFDHWFRLFLPPTPTAPATSSAPLILPTVKGRAWWRSYRSIPAEQRPHWSNYTVADFRQLAGKAELDIDVVLHWNQAGELGGKVAAWAVTAETGSPLALLDQGVMFDPPADTAAIRLACDATGQPAIRGILRSLDPAATGDAVVEVPTPDDIVQLEAPPGVTVEHITPPKHDAVPGAAALTWLERAKAPGPADYAFIVGESGLATAGRRLLRRQGLPKSRISFKGFWKHR